MKRNLIVAAALAVGIAVTTTVAASATTLTNNVIGPSMGAAYSNICIYGGTATESFRHNYTVSYSSAGNVLPTLSNIAFQPMAKPIRCGLVLYTFTVPSATLKTVSNTVACSKANFPGTKLTSAQWSAISGKLLCKTITSSFIYDSLTSNVPGITIGDISISIPFGVIVNWGKPATLTTYINPFDEANYVEVG